MSKDSGTDNGEWEAQLDALLANELEPAAIRSLQARASGDETMTRALADASALRLAMAAMGTERAPARLRRKLRRIPRDQQSGHTNWYLRPAWIAGLALVPAVIVLIGPWGGQPADTQAIARGRQDLGIALAYLDRTTLRASRQLEATINHTINDPVTRNLVTVLDQQLELNRE
jgi:anti-sigma factor RsiW